MQFWNPEEKLNKCKTTIIKNQMEIKNLQKGQEETQMILEGLDNDQITQHPLLKVLNNKGKLIFKKLQKNNKKSNQTFFRPVPVIQRAANTKFFILPSNNGHQLFQVKDRQIQYISSHRVDFPVYGRNYYRITSENHCRYFFRKDKLERSQKHQEFFEEHKIDWVNSSCLVFEYSYGIGQSEIIMPVFLGELRNNIGMYLKSYVCDIFDHQKPLFNKSLCLLKLTSQNADMGFLQHKDDLFLAEFAKFYPNLTRKVFRINLRFQALNHYRRKIEEDKKKLPQIFHDDLEVYRNSKSFYLDNDELGRAQKLKPFIKVEREMITVGVVDFRKKKIPVKSFVSVYELFEGLEFTAFARANFCNIFRIDYCIEADVLVIDLWINLLYNSREEAERVLGGGRTFREGERRDKKNLSYFYSDRNGRVKDVRKMRFVVDNVLRRADRRVRVTHLGYISNSSFKKSLGSILLFEENAEKFMVEVISREPNEKAVVSQSVEISRNRKIEKKSKKAVKTIFEQNLVRKLDLVADELITGEGDSYYDISSALKIENDQILLTTSRKLILFDINTKELLSSYDYSNNVPTNLDNSLIDQDVMIGSSDNKKYIEVFKLLKDLENDSLQFNYAGFLDLNNFNQFHSIRKLNCFRKVGNEIFEVKTEVNWLREEDNVTSPSVLSVRFQILPKNGRNQQFELNMISGSIDCEGDGTREGLTTYIKNGQTNHTFVHRAVSLGLQINNSDPGENHQNQQKYYFDRPLGHPLTGMKPIKKAHFRDNFVYLNLGYYRNKELRMIEYEADDENNRMVAPVLRKIIRLGVDDEAHFDETTDLFRIFITTDKPRSAEVSFVILDENLEKTAEFFIPQILRISSFTIISTKYLHLVASKEVEIEGEDRDEESSFDSAFDSLINTMNADRVKVSLLVDLERLSVKEMVGDDGEPLFAFPENWFGDQLLAFTKYFQSLSSNHSDGIYTSSWLN